jgi:taspase (threonine aspartase 1)
MAVLRNGGSSLDAVEMAVRVLEDREITNAGYGSNLAMDGTVECDATIVDYLGRSGAVGAVSRKYEIRTWISPKALVYLDFV